MSRRNDQLHERAPGLPPGLAARATTARVALANLLAEAQSHRTSPEHRCSGRCDCVGTRAALAIRRLDPTTMAQVLQAALGQLAQRIQDGAR